MAKINILDKQTIDKIAAGEVIDRPLNVVKELIENSIDAQASAITIEIKDGGISFIRVTDDGAGIEKSEIKKAFMAHATSKIEGAEDLLKISSLGFRGEALSTISAVSMVNVITKTEDSLTGTSFNIDGGIEGEMTDIGAPCGTTFIVKDLFYNVPVRRKFLKSAQTEGSYISDLLEHIALSHPEIAFKFINNGKIVFATSGNGSLKEVIYRIYGRDTADKVLPLNIDSEIIKVEGYLGKPELNRSSRNFETFFVNGRYVNCPLVSKAAEEGYSNYLMMHKFPFLILQLSVDPSEVDVNVHPSKMEIRLHNSEEIYSIISKAIEERLSERELIPDAYLDEPEKEAPIEVKKAPEPFEKVRMTSKSLAFNMDFEEDTEPIANDSGSFRLYEDTNISETKVTPSNEDPDSYPQIKEASQMELFEDRFLTEDSKDKYEIFGQLFKTYWLIGFSDKLFIMDQHAAHEKVKYERIVNALKEKRIATQSINPPVILELSTKEYDTVSDYLDSFTALGFEIEDFGLNSIALRGMPVDLYGCDELEFFREVLDELMDNPLKGELSVIHYKLASMACKAAVKGNMKMNEQGVRALLDELLTLDNPYNCPHGRPTLVSISKYEIEKKFKRIVT